MSNSFLQRQERLFSAMQREGLSAVLLTMSDDHGSEYIAPHFQSIAYYTGFTGSAATVLFVRGGGEEPSDTNRVYLWTDGRYFLQASGELKKSGGILMKQGMKDVPGLEEMLKKLVDANNSEASFCLGVDGRLVGGAEIRTLKKAVVGRHAKSEKFCIKGDCRLCNELWDADKTDPRPPLSFGRIWELSETYAGASMQQKLTDIRAAMEKEDADTLILTDLDEIAWCINLRGGDIAYHPVFYAFLILTKEDATLFHGTEQTFDGLTSRPYEDFYDALKALPAESRIWVDGEQASFLVMELLSDRKDLIKKASPVKLMKAVKNETEIRNMKRAHQKDGVALTKWIFALKQQEKAFEETGADPNLSELSVSADLQRLRSRQTHYIEDSFAPILAFGAHGAIVHYEPTKETDLPLSFGQGAYLLADTGGHYLEGTTDVTRTISLGEPSGQQKQHYTAVLKGHLRLLAATFLDGAAGSSLDQLAREPLYELGLDYRHGTGHGVGYLLSVHEGPNAFRMKHTKDNVIREGMITSDEPGVYLEGAYGIRLESLILSVRKNETEYGTFLGFEPLTMVPFDRESILADALSEREKDTLNAYHRQVYESLCEDLTEDEKTWLYEQTRPF
ncbi:MAG: aminopeptidase P family N-terminal domain-containing protein [Lachnospiraceae bacterium]|nr:aminopeptidase P family N-terminal domain-containing protein [Lachnospiraceae bacterium]